MKRMIGGVLTALAIVSVPVVVPAAAGATTAPQPTADVQPFIWGYYAHLKTYTDCVAAGDWGIRAGRWRGYDCQYDPADWEWPWDLYVDYI